MKFSACFLRVFLLATLSAAMVLLAGCGGYGGGGGNGGGGGALTPPAPTGLMATHSSGQVNLTWSASSGATGYYVKRSITSGNEAQIATVSATSYVDTAVTNGTLYYYEVAAYNSYGQSANSAEVSVTAGPIAPPATPASLQILVGNGQVRLAWDASAGATSYVVKRSMALGGPYTQVSFTTATNYTDTGLANGTTYYYVVSALNMNGESANSSEGSATPSSAIAADVTSIPGLPARQPN